MELSRRPRGLVVVRKPDRKPTRVEEFQLRLSTSWGFDGLWVGTREAEPHPALRRVEDALRLIKRHDKLHYSRIIRNIERVWVHLLPSALAHYQSSINACVFDGVLFSRRRANAQKIASTIIHEATHARLDGWGIDYDEATRYRIEAICIRRELNFLTKLPDSEHLQEEIAYALSGTPPNRTTSPIGTIESATTRARLKHFAIWEHRTGSSNLRCGSSGDDGHALPDE